jgi:hypothetical protein
LKRAFKISARLDQAFSVKVQAPTDAHQAQKDPAPAGPARHLYYLGLHRHQEKEKENEIQI